MGKLTQEFITFAKEKYGYDISLCSSQEPAPVEMYFRTISSSATAVVMTHRAISRARTRDTIFFIPKNLLKFILVAPFPERLKPWIMP